MQANPRRKGKDHHNNSEKRTINHPQEHAKGVVEPGILDKIVVPLPPHVFIVEDKVIWHRCVGIKKKTPKSLFLLTSPTFQWSFWNTFPWSAACDLSSHEYITDGYGNATACCTANASCAGNQQTAATAERDRDLPTVLGQSTAVRLNNRGPWIT